MTVSVGWTGSVYNMDECETGACQRIADIIEHMATKSIGKAKQDLADRY